MALYGATSTPVPWGRASALASAIKEVIAGAVATQAAQALTWLPWGLKAPDPMWHILRQRARITRM
eukprot:10889969-Alexandrium_andersonii.AAC.1